MKKANLKDAKEFKKQIEGVIKNRRTNGTECILNGTELILNSTEQYSTEQNKKRTKCTESEKKSLQMSKNARKNKKTVQKLSERQKEKKNKFRKFWLRLIAFEYITVGAILLWFFGTSLVQTNEKLVAQVDEQHVIIQNLAEQVTELRAKPIAIKTIEIIEERIYLGTFKITHYCECKICCGPNAQGITASGKRVQANKTIAVDPKVIKLGSQVYIDGYGYMEAQDTGSAIKGNIIDVYVEDHQEALKMGVQYKDVYLIK